MNNISLSFVIYFECSLIFCIEFDLKNWNDKKKEVGKGQVKKINKLIHILSQAIGSKQTTYLYNIARYVIVLCVQCLTGAQQGCLFPARDNRRTTKTSILN